MKRRLVRRCGRRGFTLIEILVVAVLFGLLALVGVRGLFTDSGSSLETLQTVFAEGRQEAVDGGEAVILRLEVKGELGLYRLAEQKPFRKYQPPKGAVWRLEPAEFYFFSDGSVSPGKVFLDRKGKTPRVFWIAVTGQVVPQDEN